MIATRQNHTVPMAPSLIGRRVGEIAATVSARLGPHFNLAINQKQPQNGQYRVHAHEADEREPGIARGYARRNSFRGAHQSINQPGLAPQSSIAATTGTAMKIVPRPAITW